MPERSDEELIAALSRLNPLPPASRDRLASASADLLLEPILLGRRRAPWRVALYFAVHRSLGRVPTSFDDATLEEALATINPATDAAVRAATWSGRAEALFEELVQTRPRRSRSWAPRRRALAGVLVALCVIGAAAGYAIASRPVRLGYVVRCFQAAELTSRSTFVYPAGQAAAVACRSGIWDSGLFGNGRPHLVTCLGPSGEQWVFPGPGPSVCAKLNLSVALTPKGIASAEALLNHDLLAAVTKGMCPTEAQSRLIMRRDLRKVGLGAWRIEVDAPPQPSRPCYIPGVNIVAHVVTLTPTPRPPPTVPSGASGAPAPS